MRYDTPIYFQTVTPGEYDANTGNYAAETVTEVKRYASVTDSGTQTMMLIYGELKQGSKTIRLQQPYTSPFRRIRIGDKVYSVDRQKMFRNSHIIVVSEVQGNGKN